MAAPRLRSSSSRILLAAALLLTGCAGHPVIAPRVPAELAAKPVELMDTPFFPQQAYQCGPAALATVMTGSGAPVSPEALRDRVYLPGKRGSLQVELLAAARRGGRVPYVIDPDLAAVLEEVAAGRPVLVLQNLGLNIRPTWHYAVVIGFDAAADRVVLRSGEQRRLELSARRFLDTWERAGRWGFVVLRPNELPARPDRERYLKAVSALERGGSPDLPVTAFANAYARWPQDDLALFGLATAYLNRGDLDQAERLLRRLITRNPRHVAGRNNLAVALMERGCPREALAQIDTAIAIDATGDYAQALQDTRADILNHGASERGCASRGAENPAHRFSRTAGSV